MPPSAFFKTSSSTGTADSAVKRTWGRDVVGNNILQQQHYSTVQSSVKPHVTGIAHEPINGSTLVRGWRFPSSRRFLWDRSSSGPIQYVHPKEYVPEISIYSDVLPAAKAVFEGYQQRNNAQMMCGALTVAVHDKGLSLGLKPCTPGAARAQEGPDQLSVPCTVEQEGDPSQLRPSPDTSAARAILRSALERRGPAHLAQLVSAACHLTLRSDGTASLQGCLLLPESPLALCPLYPKRLCDVPLSSQLLSPMPAGTPASNGFLTMDQARSLLPLAADDPNVFSVPLVGVWVRGVSSINHPLVLAAAVRFAFCTTLTDKVTQDGSFMLLVFPPEGASLPQCYDARFHVSSEGAATPSLLQFSFQGELLQRASGAVKAVGLNNLGSSAPQQVGAPVILRPQLDLQAQPLGLGPGSPLLSKAPHSTLAVASASGGVLDVAPVRDVGKQQRFNQISGVYTNDAAIRADTLPAESSPPPAPRSIALPTPFRTPAVDATLPAPYQQHIQQTAQPVRMPYTMQQMPMSAPTEAGAMSTDVGAHTGSYQAYQTPAPTLRGPHDPVPHAQDDMDLAVSAAPPTGVMDTAIAPFRQSLDNWLLTRSQQAATGAMPAQWHGAPAISYGAAVPPAPSASMGGAAAGAAPGGSASGFPAQGVGAAAGPGLGSQASVRRSSSGLVKPLYNPLESRPTSFPGHSQAGVPAGVPPAPGVGAHGTWPSTAATLSSVPPMARAVSGPAESADARGRPPMPSAAAGGGMAKQYGVPAHMHAPMPVQSFMPGRPTWGSAGGTTFGSSGSGSSAGGASDAAPMEQQGTVPSAVSTMAALRANRGEPHVSVAAQQRNQPVPAPIPWSQQVQAVVQQGGFAPAATAAAAAPSGQLVPGMSTDAWALQQEVLALRQQVQDLQAQLATVLAAPAGHMRQPQQQHVDLVGLPVPPVRTYAGGVQSNAEMHARESQIGREDAQLGSASLAHHTTITTVTTTISSDSDVQQPASQALRPSRTPAQISSSNKLSAGTAVAATSTAPTSNPAVSLPSNGVQVNNGSGAVASLLPGTACGIEQEVPHVRSYADEERELFGSPMLSTSLPPHTLQQPPSSNDSTPHSVADVRFSGIKAPRYSKGDASPVSPHMATGSAGQGSPSSDDSDMPPRHAMSVCKADQAGITPRAHVACTPAARKHIPHRHQDTDSSSNNTPTQSGSSGGSGIAVKLVCQASSDGLHAAMSHLSTPASARAPMPDYPRRPSKEDEDSVLKASIGEPLTRTFDLQTLRRSLGEGLNVQGHGEGTAVPRTSVGGASFLPVSRVSQDIVRTRYVPDDDDDSDNDSDFDEQLMAKYGLR